MTANETTLSGQVQRCNLIPSFLQGMNLDSSPDCTEKERCSCSVCVSDAERLVSIVMCYAQLTLLSAGWISSLGTRLEKVQTEATSKGMLGLSNEILLLISSCCAVATLLYRIVVQYLISIATPILSLDGQKAADSKMMV